MVGFGTVLGRATQPCAPTPARGACNADHDDPVEPAELGPLRGIGTRSPESWGHYESKISKVRTVMGVFGLG